MKSRSGGFPFDAAIGFGMCVLKLSPSEIWAMTPREMVAAARYLGGEGGAARRGDLERLMQMFPDTAHRSPLLPPSD